MNRRGFMGTHPDSKMCICQGQGSYFVARRWPEPVLIGGDFEKTVWEPLAHDEVICTYHGRGRKGLTEEDAAVLTEAGIKP